MGLYLVGGMLHSGKKSSIFVTGSYSFMAVHMQDLLTTDEAATYLRLSERKLYELVANGAVPCTKVTGKWLFPKAALDRWLAAGLLTPALAHAPAPPIVGGSHDPLLEWALRESASVLASLPEGSETGLLRLARGEVTAAAIHLHRLDGDDEVANCDAVASAAGLHDAVVIAVARPRAGARGRGGQSIAAQRRRRHCRQARAACAAAAGRGRAAAFARARGPRRLCARRAGIGATGLPDRRRYRPGGARRSRRLRDRDTGGRAGGRARLRAAHMGALRSRVAPARLFPAGPAGAVQIRSHRDVPRTRQRTHRL